MAAHDLRDFERKQLSESLRQQRLAFDMGLHHARQEFQLRRVVRCVAVCLFIAIAAVSVWVIAHPDVYRGSALNSAMGIMGVVLCATAKILAGDIDLGWFKLSRPKHKPPSEGE